MVIRRMWYSSKATQADPWNETRAQKQTYAYVAFTIRRKTAVALKTIGQSRDFSVNISRTIECLCDREGVGGGRMGRERNWTLLFHLV